MKCKTRKYVRMYHRIQKNKKELEEQKEQLYDIVDSKHYKKIEEEVENSKQKLLRFLVLAEEQKKNIEKPEEKKRNRSSI